MSSGMASESISLNPRNLQTDTIYIQHTYHVRNSESSLIA